MKRILDVPVAAAFVLLAGPSSATTLTVDLARQSAGTTITLPAAAFPTLNLTVINRVPRFSYDITVVDSIIPVEPLKYDGKVDIGATADLCETTLKRAKGLHDAADEAEVGKTVETIRSEVGQCDDPAKAAEIRGLVSTTVVEYPGTFIVRDGHQLTVTVTRDSADGKSKLTWVTVVKGEDRGLWLTTFGAVGSPDKDELFYSAGADKKFTITRQSEAEGYKVTPSVFFTWLSRKRQTSDLAYGPTAGFGVKDDMPAVFAGYGFTYNWNLGLVLGLGLVKEARLNGKYTEGQELTEALDADQLHKQIVQVRPFIALTFRFGSNPFESKAKDPAPAEKAKETKSEKEAAKPVGK